MRYRAVAPLVLVLSLGLPVEAFALSLPFGTIFARNDMAPPSTGEARQGGPESMDSGLRIQDYLTLRDPFRRPISKELIVAEDAIPAIQRFPADQFKLVGVITGSKKNKALIKDPGGKMHIVTEANKIGTRGGVVTKITSSQVLVEEKMRNLLGEEERIDVVIGFLQKKDTKHDQQDVGYINPSSSSGSGISGPPAGVSFGAGSPTGGVSSAGAGGGGGGGAH